MSTDGGIQPDESGKTVEKTVVQLLDDVEAKWSQGGNPDLATLVHSLDSKAQQRFLSQIVHREYSRDPNPATVSKLRDKYDDLLPEHESLLGFIFAALGKDVPKPVDVSQRLVQQQPLIKEFTGKKIGEYNVEKKLGGGGFGVVYLARDQYLPRSVVIKIPLLNRLAGEDSVEKFLDEARNAAMLSHPNILKVLYVGMDEGMPYIVQEFFEGGDLSNALDESKFSTNRTVAFIAKLARAIGYAHKNKIIHRDLKPANILIDANGEPVIADFGLSLFEPQLRGQRGEMVGTIRYMSPEQVRGEAHRLDGRTDIWSIGVILYLMLVRQYPFDGPGIGEIGEAILFGQACPPRQLNEKISLELERICLKCLANRVSDRYSTAFDLAEDLEGLIELEGSGSKGFAGSGDSRPFSSRFSSSRFSRSIVGKTSLVPKGLAAFDGSDCEFFLDLLPGPKDRIGVPESIRFWVEKFENPSVANSVSLLFGPSGCGKSSLVSAGVIPLLSEDIITVEIEATAEDTETRFTNALRSKFPDIPDQISLPELMTELRRGSWLPWQKRLLIVFDQFEQWLHANPIDEHSPLINALRQCDGQRVQTLILAREDFWMAITRFFRQLEIDLVERENFACVDLFTKRHAKEVLTKYGQAYGTLPEKTKDISQSADMFLDRAIDMLAEKDSVICVRSALFAETVKNKKWDLETLKQLGDAKNIGIAFLDQTIGSEATNPKYRFHRDRLMGVLSALLPPRGVEIKGSLKSRDQLAEAIDVAVDDADFVEVLNILDSELRLITPTEPDYGAKSDEKKLFYQLTHDYLVPSIREWIDSIQGSTIRGRAQLKLSELSAAWGNSKDARFLPGLLEYLSFLWNVPKRTMSFADQQMMRTAGQFYGLRTLATMGFAGLLTVLVWNLSDNKHELMSQALSCSPGELVDVVDQLYSRPDVFSRMLRENVKEQTDWKTQFRSRVILGLLGRSNKEEIEFLVDSVPDAKADQVVNLSRALANSRDAADLLLDEKLKQGFGTEDWVRYKIIRLFNRPNTDLADVLAFVEDPSVRSRFFHILKSWHGDLANASRILSQRADVAELSGACICLGIIPRQSYQDESLNAVVDSLENLYTTHPSSAVHSAARWALTNLGSSLPVIEPMSPKNGSQWWITKQNLQLIRINKGIAPNDYRDGKHPSVKPDVIEEEFFISSCEITAGLFQQFLDDPRATRPPDRSVIEISEDKDVVASGLCIEDAYLFCNWLSEINGLNPAYKMTGKTLPPVKGLGSALSILTEIPEFVVDESANGYRVPRFAEHSMAARSGVVTTENYISSEYSFPGLGDHVWYRVNSNGEVQRVGQKIPNYIGVFDLIGNANEFVYEEQPSKTGFSIYLWGASVGYAESYCNIGDDGESGSIPWQNGCRKLAGGFRVVLPANR